MNEEQARELISVLNVEEKQQLYMFLKLMEQASPETQEDVYRILMEGKA